MERPSIAKSEQSLLVLTLHGMGPCLVKRLVAQYRYPKVVIRIHGNVRASGGFVLIETQK